MRDQIKELYDSTRRLNGRLHLILIAAFFAMLYEEELMWFTGSLALGLGVSIIAEIKLKQVLDCHNEAEEAAVKIAGKGEDK